MNGFIIIIIIILFLAKVICKEWWTEVDEWSFQLKSKIATKCERSLISMCLFFS